MDCSDCVSFVLLCCDVLSVLCLSYSWLPAFGSFCQVATIQSDRGAERTIWQVLQDDLHQDNILVIANRMNPKLAGMLQTRERLYQIWYQHESSKKNNAKFAIDDGRVPFAAVDAENHMAYLSLHMDLGLNLPFPAPRY